MSSLGRRKETSDKNMDKSLCYYDSPVKRQQDEVWLLRKDCVPLEESLKDTVEWLKSMGVEFLGAFKYFEGSEATWHIVKTAFGAPGPRAAAGMYKIMTEHS